MRVIKISDSRVKHLSHYSILGLLLYVSVCHAQQGKNGAQTITGINTVLNEYTYLTADANSAHASISVNNSFLNSHSRFAQPLSAGDLIMIIQVQGASINGSSRDSTWGAITNYNNCGLYEFAEVASIPNGNTININCSLKNSYSAAGKTQVVRVPRYTSLIVSTGDTLTCDAWNGTTGGIVVAEVRDSTTIDAGGVIDATGEGFRGGALQNTSAPYNVQTYVVMSADSGGQKGEGIAGYGTDYNIYGGMYGRGAPANGGGGGNSFNSSGGGGADAGALNNWNGDGNPDTSNATWIAAWNLEYVGFAQSNSSGGGRGGYCFSWTVQNALTDPPGNPNWTGDDRNNHGGSGGHPLDYSTGRIFFGGGGGSGHEDNGNGSGGANGGGIVYLLDYGTINGSGYILSNGSNAGNSTGDYGANGDGAGGAGGGGSIILASTGSITGITAIANGGKGGSQVIPGGDEAEGPGGGGGGGYIAVSNGAILQQALGGANGTSNSPAVVGFPPNGATKGGDGLTNQTINLVPLSSLTINTGPNVSICAGTSANLSVSGGTGYTWSPSATLSCDTCSSTMATPTSTTTYFITATNGSCTGTGSIVVTILNHAIAGVISSVSDHVCIGDSINLFITGDSGSIQWQSSPTGYDFADISGADGSSYLIQPKQTTYFRVWANSGLCSDTSQPYVIIADTPPAPPILYTIDSTICLPGSTQISSSGTYSSYRWNDGDTTSYTYADSSGEYWLTVTDMNGCSATSGRQNITAHTAVTPLLFTNDSIICTADSTRINTSGSYSSYLWNNGDTTSSTYADSSGEYWLTVTDANGCTAISGKQGITVLTAVVPLPYTNDSIICTSDSTRINTSGLYSSYLWNDGDTTSYTFADQAGDYYVTVTDFNGCSAVSRHLAISVYPVPSVSILVEGDTLASLNAVTYQWFFDNDYISDADKPVYVAGKSGDYALQVTDTNGCTTLSNSVQITITGFGEIDETDLLKLYPNPFSNNIYLELNSSPGIKTVELYDLSGRKIFSQFISGLYTDYLLLSFPELPAGAYYMRIGDGEGYYIEKIVKN